MCKVLPIKKLTFMVSLCTFLLMLLFASLYRYLAEFLEEFLYLKRCLTCASTSGLVSLLCLCSCVLDEFTSENLDVVYEFFHVNMLLIVCSYLPFGWMSMVTFITRASAVS